VNKNNGLNRFGGVASALPDFPLVFLAEAIFAF
jgi:hypothetical protein